MVHQFLSSFGPNPIYIIVLHLPCTLLFFMFTFLLNIVYSAHTSLMSTQFCDLSSTSCLFLPGTHLRFVQMGYYNKQKCLIFCVSKKVSYFVSFQNSVILISLRSVKKLEALFIMMFYIQAFVFKNLCFTNCIY